MQELDDYIELLKRELDDELVGAEKSAGVPATSEAPVNWGVEQEMERVIGRCSEELWKLISRCKSFFGGPEENGDPTLADKKMAGSAAGSMSALEVEAPPPRP